LIIEDLFNGKDVQLPTDPIGFKKAEEISENKDRGRLLWGFQINVPLCISPTEMIIQLI